jgi:F-type H+-transporting ATPase subunit gamma
MAFAFKQMVKTCTMSSQVELSQRYDRLQEISSIMTAMKSMALVETKKLARFIEHQRRMLSNIETAAADFQNFFSMEHYDETQPAVMILIGSERGFCGNFNEHLMDALYALPIIKNAIPVQLVVVGSRLSAKLDKRSDVIARSEGPTVTEEVPAVLNRIMDALRKASGAALFVLAYEAEGTPVLKQIIPFEPVSKRKFTNPPSLQLSPSEFLTEMLDQYLLAILYGLLYESLAAESHQRLAHMEQALNRLDETVSKLNLKRNAMRQEKIIEEIEVILSSQQAFESLD